MAKEENEIAELKRQLAEAVARVKAEEKKEDTPEDIRARVEAIRRRHSVEGGGAAPSSSSSPYKEWLKKRIVENIAQLEDEIEAIRIGKTKSELMEKVKKLKRKLTAMEMPKPKLKLINGRLAWVKRNGEVAKMAVSMKKTLEFFGYSYPFSNPTIEIIAGDPYKKDNYLLIFASSRNDLGNYLISKKQSGKHISLSKEQTKKLKEIISERPQNRKKIKHIIKNNPTSLTALSGQQAKSFFHDGKIFSIERKGGEIFKDKEEELMKLQNRRCRFRGNFVRFGIMKDRFNFFKKAIVIKNICICESGERIAAEYCFDYTKEFMKLGKLKADDIVEFDARVSWKYRSLGLRWLTKLELKTKEKRKKMFKFTELTEEQEKLLRHYREKWLEIGLNIEPVDKELAKEGIVEAYRAAGLKSPKEVIWLKSPAACLIAYQVMRKNPNWKEFRNKEKLPILDEIANEVNSQIQKHTKRELGDQVWYKIKRHLCDQVDISILDHVWNPTLIKIRQKTFNRIILSVRRRIWAIILEHFGDRFQYQMKSFIYGQYESFWLAAYDYMYEVLGLKFLKILEGLQKFAMAGGWALCYENICFVSERANISRFENNRFHCDNGPVIQYPDGYTFYALNEVIVPKEYVETPAELLNPQLVIKENNAERRRELVRKIGIERVCRELDVKLLDKWNGYELLEITIEGMRIKPIYLKMRNPSTGTWHIEGVPPEIRTCKEALSWRVGGLKWQPEQLA